MLNLQQLSAEKSRLEKISQEEQLQKTRITLFFVVGILCLVFFFWLKQRTLHDRLQRSKDKLDEKNRVLTEARE